jgi:hypothetical protein
MPLRSHFFGQFALGLHRSGECHSFAPSPPLAVGIDNVADVARHFLSPARACKLRQKLEHDIGDRSEETKIRMNNQYCGRPVRMAWTAKPIAIIMCNAPSNGILRPPQVQPQGGIPAEQEIVDK